MQFSESNAIVRRIEILRDHWYKSVKEKTKIIRWLCQPDELSMLDAFCMVEGSDKGVLEDLFLIFTSGVQSSEPYDLTFLQEWLGTWNNSEEQKKMETMDVKVAFDSEKWDKKIEENKPVSILECMSEFASSIAGFEGKLVLYFRPTACDSYEDWTKWIFDLSESDIPENIRLMFWDIKKNELLDFLEKDKSAVTMEIDLNMNSAMEEIAGSGDDSDPMVKYNNCLFNMSKALARKDFEQVNEWGQKAMQTGRSIGSRGMEIVAGLAYGSTLLQLKKREEALQQFSWCQNMAENGIEEGDDDCKGIYLQAVSFEAAVYMHTKNYRNAFPVYAKLKDLASDTGNYIMAIDACYMSSFTADKINKSEESYSSLLQGLQILEELTEEQGKYSSCLLVGKELYQKSEKNRDYETRDRTNTVLTSLWGENWQETANFSDKEKKEYKQNLFASLNLFGQSRNN